MKLSSSRQASPLRVATGGDASWRLKARHRRSPACCQKAWPAAQAISGRTLVSSIALYYTDKTTLLSEVIQNVPTDYAEEAEWDCLM